MRRVGRSYLVVTHDVRTQPPFQASDGGKFHDEKEMLTELGATLWELLWLREDHGRLLYYFKRPRT